MAVERREDIDQEPESSKYWLAELAAASQREKNWREERVPKIIKRYRDESRDQSSTRKTNILWANTEVVEAALFPELPGPDVRRRFGDAAPVARKAALVLERAVAVCNDLYDVEAEISGATHDHALTGRGVLWVVYEAEVGPDPETGDEAIVSQEWRTERVPWKFYREGEAESWSKMPWVARGHLMTAKDVDALNPEQKYGSQVPKNHKIAGANDDKESASVYERALVWQIWDRTQRERVFVAEGFDTILKRDPDPYGLRGFFPCPRPMYAVEDDNEPAPIPEYTLYQDQAEELDMVTGRIAHLLDAMRRRGVMSKAAYEEVANLATAGDNDFIPVENWQAFREAGGLKGVMEVEEITGFAEVLVQLRQHRAELVQTIYEVTGISDVHRAVTDPNETLGAQRLKAQFGGARFGKRKKNTTDRIIRDLYRIKGELIAEHAEPELLAEMTGIDMPMTQEAEQGDDDNRQVTWADVMEVLRSDAKRGFKIDIESETTGLEDAEADKKARFEFVTVIREALSDLLSLSRENPKMIGFALPMVRETVMFTVRGFKVGRTLEEGFEDAFKQLAKLAQTAAQQPDQPSPEMAEVERRSQADQMKARLDEREIERKEQNDQMTNALKQMATMLDRIETMAKVQDMRQDNERADAELALKASETVQ